ncbi:hypothetical protein [Escherichia coli]|uniref:hypothetical protein n=1 Tax=Escherichia coli TaxID=562 RepID=UPI001FAA1B9D|nr:hypothetical protein [Escherichia coli]MCI5463059.1 hypothetical protein [Escherichia coli]
MTGEKKAFLHVECNGSQKAVWNNSARARKMKLEEWVKEALDEKGKRTDPLHLGISRGFV